MATASSTDCTRSAPARSRSGPVADFAASTSPIAPNAGLVFDSGDAFEQITRSAYPAQFNASNNNTTRDNRSDNKGPEPEGVAVGRVGPRDYAFIALERIGG